MAPDEGGRGIRGEDSDDRARRESRREEERRHAAPSDDHDESDHGDGESGGEDKKSRILHNRFFQIGAALVVIALIAGGILYWLHARHFEDTDDAFIDAHIVHLSPQVVGRVSEVVVNDNQLVHKGDPLVEIDPADVKARLAQVEAQAAQAEKQYQQALAMEKGAEAQADNARHDVERYQLLLRTAPQAVAQQQLDQAISTQRNTAAQLESARAQIASAQAQIEVFKAQIDAAKLNLGYTHIVAPIDGHIAQRTVAVGNYVAPGQQLMAIVPLDVWVTANFKETQLAYMRVGQPVTVDIDSCPGVVMDGHVDSLQRGAGQAFGILPPENATGNYVKVVQRVPVKIVLDEPRPKDCPLGPGMSVEPTVKVR